MPYFVHIESRTVAHTLPGSRLGAAYLEIPADVAQRYSLSHGVTLSPEQVAELQSPTGATWTPPAPPAAAATAVPSGPSNLPLAVARGAEQIALVVEVIAWVLGAVSVVAGLILMLTARDSEFGYGDETHPFVGAGIALAVGGLFQCLIVVMVARYIRARMMLARAGRA